jgi:hypothetical protein
MTTTRQKTIGSRSKRSGPAGKRGPGDAVERFLTMSEAERDADVARYDEPMPVGPDGLPGEPLTPEMHRQWEDSKIRRRGRKKVGRGAKRILVTVERGLLADADRFAKGRQMKRSELIAAGLRLAMAQMPAGTLPVAKLPVAKVPAGKKV